VPIRTKVRGKHVGNHDSSSVAPDALVFSRSLPLQKKEDLAPRICRKHEHIEYMHSNHKGSTIHFWVRPLVLVIANHVEGLAFYMCLGLERAGLYKFHSLPVLHRSLCFFAGDYCDYICDSPGLLHALHMHDFAFQLKQRGSKQRRSSQRHLKRTPAQTIQRERIQRKQRV